MFKWVIVGGGIQGCTAVSFLIKNGMVKPRDLLINDPHPFPLYKWKRITSKIGMDYLRSPSVHHLDTDPFSLEKYAKKSTCPSPFLGRFNRPNLRMFNDHCDTLFEQIEIGLCWCEDKVMNLDSIHGRWLISTEKGKVIETEGVACARYKRSAALPRIDKVYI
ncbi:hypothetical protein ACE1TI_09060 [Alteribacillus sp. JSM 102045]|uniref:hypothetical protein n=1 Tax=Alteribacillus sp. JSM 102045 TaxID=1562101 RepID=UPI0035BF6B73